MATSHSTTPTPGPSRTVAFTVRLLVLAALVVIPLRIVRLGFLPPDDALRHAAKAVSGRPWAEIVLLRPGMTLDAHTGWHAFLGAVHRATGADAHALVLLSVILLFVVASLPAALVLRRPEAGLAALLVLTLADVRSFSRLVSGRPLLLSMAVVCTVALVWPRLRDRLDPRLAALLVALFAVATVAHGSWFLFLLPLACFFLVGERRCGLRLTACWAAGVVAGAVLTGHPVGFLVQAVRHVVLSLGSGEPTRALTMEFQPAQGAPLMVAAVAIVLSFRAQQPLRRASLADPVFALAVAGWVLGFVTLRFWTDWGAPAAVVWIALELEHALESRVGPEQPRRLALGAALVLATALAITNDHDGRFTAPQLPALTSRDSRQAEWLPQPGGILYSTEMWVFYRTFYGNPLAPWRYALGFEPGLMPPEDLAIFRAYLARGGDTSVLQGWQRKMRPADRLVVAHDPGSPPAVSGLEWHQVLPGVWSGRLAAASP